MSTRFPLFLVLATLVLLGGRATSPLWQDWEHARQPEKNDDWDNQLLLAEAQREALLQFGAPPLWNAYPEGGTPLLANPESTAAYPLTWLTLPLPTQHSLRVQLVLHFFIGLFGMYRLSRKLELSPVASAYAAIVFMGASIFPERVRAGHLMWMGMAWLPWVIGAGLEMRAGSSLVAAVALAAQWLVGAHYLVIYSISALVVLRYQAQLRSTATAGWSLGLLVLVLMTSPRVPPDLRPLLLLLPVLPLLIRHPRGMLREGWHVSAALVLFCLITAVKLLPALELWRYSARFAVAELLTPPDAGPWQSVARWAGMLARDPVEVHEDQPTLYHALPLLLALLGFAARPGRARAFIALFLVGWWWSLGPGAPLPLSPLAESLPVVSLVRYTARAAILTLIALSIGAGFGVGVVEARIHRMASSRMRGVGMAALSLTLLASAAWMATRSHDIYGGTFNGSAPAAKSYLTPFSRERCTTPMYQAFHRHRGCVDGFTAVPIVNARHVHARGEGGYRGEVYLVGASGEAVLETWEPNRIAVRVAGLQTAGQGAGPDSGYVVLNQSYFPGWRLEGGQPLESWQGLLAAPLQEESHLYVIEYVPSSVQWGALISGVTLAAVGAFLFRQTKNR